MVNPDFKYDNSNYHTMPKTFKVPAHIDLEAPFLGILGDTAQARVMDYLVAMDEALTVSEISRATELSRLSSRRALRNLEAWGAVESRSVEGGWRRYRARLESPVVISLQLLMGAVNDAQEPGKGLFRSYAEGIVGVRLVPVRRGPSMVSAPMVGSNRGASSPAARNAKRR